MMVMVGIYLLLIGTAWNIVWPPVLFAIVLVCPILAYYAKKGYDRLPEDRKRHFD